MARLTRVPRAFAKYHGPTRSGAELCAFHAGARARCANRAPGCCWGSAKVQKGSRRDRRNTNRARTAAALRAGAAGNPRQSALTWRSHGGSSQHILASPRQPPALSTRLDAHQPSTRCVGLMLAAPDIDRCGQAPGDAFTTKSGHDGRTAGHTYSPPGHAGRSAWAK